MEMSVQLRPEAVNQSGSREFPLFGQRRQRPYD
jgi:hypothetical protein